MAQQYTPPPQQYYAPPAQPQRSNTLLYVLLGVLVGCCLCVALVCIVTFAVPSLLGPQMGGVFSNIITTLEAMTPEPGVTPLP